MNLSRTLSPLTLALSILACEPASPHIVYDGPTPADGVWQMEIIGTQSHGACEMLRGEPVVGMFMGMRLETQGETGIRFDIEGLNLKGHVDAGWIEASGYIFGAELSRNR